MAKGSHTIRGDYPATCNGCGERVRVTADCCWYETVDGELLSWHMNCRMGARKEATSG